MNNFNKLLDLFISMNNLGHYSRNENLIFLYDINTKDINNIKSEIDKITTKYKWIVIPTDGELNNINILNIDI